MKISIIGSGSWSLALTKVFINKNILIKCRDVEKAKCTFKNKNFQLTKTFSDLKTTKYIFLAIPSQTVRQNLDSLKEILTDTKTTFVVCSKKG